MGPLGDLQGENAALKVRVSHLEEEREDDEQRMQGLMTENAQLEMERDKKWVTLTAIVSALILCPCTHHTEQFSHVFCMFICCSTCMCQCKW